MALGLQSCISQVNSVKNIWTTMRPSIPSVLQMNGVNIEPRHIDRWFDETLRLLNLAENQENPDMAIVAIHFPGITSQCQALTQHAASWPSNPAGYLPNIINVLWGIRASLLWILPLGAATWENWPSRSGEIEDTLNSISQTYADAIKRIDEVKSLQAQFNVLQNSLPSVNELSSSVNKVLQEVTNAKASAEGSAANAAAKNEEAVGYTKALNEIKLKQEELLKYFDEKRAAVEATLEGASKVALAKSFNDLKDSHMWGKRGWSGAFIAGILIMAVIEYLASSSTSLPALTNDTWHIWLVSRVVIVSPVIWVTWFAAVQYSRVMRLEEDYAFKSAAAQSFYGYRKEVGADAELLRLLQETSIKNFGANPIRVLGKNDHGSPAHEALDKIFSKMDKDDIEKFIDVFKNAAEKKGTK